MSDKNDDLADFMAGEAFGYRGSLMANAGADLYDQRQRDLQMLQRPWGQKDPPRPEPRPSQPWFPGVDRWFDRMVPLTWRRRLTLVSMVFWGLVGWTYGLGAGWSESDSLWLAGGGALGGLLLFPLLVFAVKLALFCLILGVIGALCWIAYSLLGGMS